MSLEKISGKVANFYMVMLSLAEGVVEACPQAVLGLLESTFLKTNECNIILLVKGSSEKSSDMIKTLVTCGQCWNT